MKPSLKSFAQLILINFREFVREPGILFWAIVFPILMAWVLGIAFSKDTELFQNIAYIKTGNTQNTEIATFFKESTEYLHKEGTWVEYRKTFDTPVGNISFRIFPVTSDSAYLMLKQGKVSLILQDTSDSLQYFFDPKSSDARFCYMMLSSAIKKERIIYDSSSVKVLSQQGTRYIDFLIPGLLAMGIMNDFLWGIGYGLIEIRTKKLLRRMVATPMKKSLFVFSHFTARIVLVLFEIAVLLLFAKLYFQTQILGSIGAFLLIVLSGSFCFAGMSILIASRTSSSRVGNGLINFISMPMTVLSGVFFSYQNFPDFIIPVIRKLPLTALADSIRSIMNEGTGFRENLPTFLLLSLTGVVCFLIGLRIYKWY
jgi:ABC-type multidrug transport system permease subunit